jgi:dTDP-4-dehydrorhamnose 3,5-epimerase
MQYNLNTRPTGEDSGNRASGVLLLTSKIYHDTHGAFQETWNQRAMTEAGLQPIGCRIISPSQKKEMLRGIYYQANKPQGKLVRVAYGAVLDVAVDLRRNLSTFVQARRS